MLTALKNMLFSARDSGTAALTDWLPPSPGATVMYLDFDGVLHRAENESFEHMPNLVSVLASHPDTQIVISSTWRLMADATLLKSLFPASVQGRLRGVTPDLGGLRRATEIQAHAQQHGVRRFIAVDDEGELFPKDWPHLFKTERHVGLDLEAAQALSERLSALP